MEYRVCRPVGGRETADRHEVGDCAPTCWTASIEDGVEIVSPNFMNQRVLAQECRVHSAVRSGRRWSRDSRRRLPEEIIFDKADEAEAGAAQALDLKKVIEEIEVLTKQIKVAPEDERESMSPELQKLKDRKTELEEAIEQAKKARAEAED